MIPLPTHPKFTQTFPALDEVRAIRVEADTLKAKAGDLARRREALKATKAESLAGNGVAKMTAEIHAIADESLQLRVDELKLAQKSMDWIDAAIALTGWLGRMVDIADKQHQKVLAEIDAACGPHASQSYIANARSSSGRAAMTAEVADTACSYRNQLNECRSQLVINMQRMRETMTETINVRLAAVA